MKTGRNHLVYFLLSPLMQRECQQSSSIETNTTVFFFFFSLEKKDDFGSSKQCSLKERSSTSFKLYFYLYSLQTGQLLFLQ